MKYYKSPREKSREIDRNIKCSCYMAVTTSIRVNILILCNNLLLHTTSFPDNATSNIFDQIYEGSRNK